LSAVVCSIHDLAEVFLALITNAAHAIEDVVGEGPGRGKITVKTSMEDSNIVLVTVSDTGCGIPEEIKTRVFDPFFTTKEVGRGKGQGLAIARAVVDTHGGELDLDSSVNVGTTVYVRLPIDGKRMADRAARAGDTLRPPGVGASAPQ
jgi:signal transduction histidine kinase